MVISSGCKIRAAFVASDLKKVRLGLGERIGRQVFIGPRVSEKEAAHNGQRILVVPVTPAAGRGPRARRSNTIDIQSACEPRFQYQATQKRLVKKE